MKSILILIYSIEPTSRPLDFINYNFYAQRNFAFTLPKPTYEILTRFRARGLTHKKTSVVQYNEYYPFGLQNQNSWTRENVKGNNFLYNDGSELNTLTGLYDTPYSGFDPALGRFHQVDPLAARYVAFSTYHYAGNNPVNMNDPSGARWSGDWETEYTGLDFAYRKDRMSQPSMFGDIDGGATALDGMFGSSGGNYSRGYGGVMYGQTKGGASRVDSMVDFLNKAVNESQYGGRWSNGVATYFRSEEEAYAAGAAYMNRHNAWGNSPFESRAKSKMAFLIIHAPKRVPQIAAYVAMRYNYELFSKMLLASLGGGAIFTQGNGPPFTLPVALDNRDYILQNTANALLYFNLFISDRLPDSWRTPGLKKSGKLSMVDLFDFNTATPKAGWQTRGWAGGGASLYNYNNGGAYEISLQKVTYKLGDIGFDDANRTIFMRENPCFDCGMKTIFWIEFSKDEAPLYEKMKNYVFR